MVGRDCDINLRLNAEPEFDAWRWHSYWGPLDSVIDFKREVYQRALQELSRYLPPQIQSDSTRRVSRSLHVANAATVTTDPTRIKIVSSNE